MTFHFLTFPVWDSTKSRGASALHLHGSHEASLNAGTRGWRETFRQVNIRAYGICETIKQRKSCHLPRIQIDKSPQRPEDMQLGTLV